MAKPSQVIVLVEDNRQRQLIFRYLRRIGLEMHAMRFVLPASGSGEQWVREQFSAEIAFYRIRSARAETKLIAVIDADNLTVQARLMQLDQKLRENGLQLIRVDEQIVRLIPRRNVETWILYLNAVQVDETTDYKSRRNDWTELIRPAAEQLYAWTRPNTQFPDNCLSSLKHGAAELRRLDFSAM
jgi:hypothetical protein